jgi:hypothetical protein
MKQFLRRADLVSARKRLKRRKAIGVFAAVTAVACIAVGSTAAWAGDHDRNGSRWSSGYSAGTASASAPVTGDSSRRAKYHGHGQGQKRSMSTPTPASTAIAVPTPAPTGTYPLHTDIVSTTFWVGEIFNASLPDDSQMISTYDGDSDYSYMKNRWVQLTGPNGSTCYGQVQDAGPSSGSLYHDADYVFGADDARPANTQFSGDSSQVSW